MFLSSALNKLKNLIVVFLTSAFFILSSVSYAFNQTEPVCAKGSDNGWDVDVCLVPIVDYKDVEFPSIIREVPSSTSIQERSYFSEPVYTDSINNQAPLDIMRFIKELFYPVGELIKDHAVTAIPGMVDGWFLCGKWCAPVGGIVAAVDESLVNNNITNHRYLTWIFTIGATGKMLSGTVTEKMANSAATKAIIGLEGKLAEETFKKVYDENIDWSKRANNVVGLVGAIVGVLIPTKVIQNNKKIAALGVSAAVGGTSVGLGGLECIIDESLIKVGFTDKHYLTGARLGIVSANFVLNSQLLGYVASKGIDYVAPKIVDYVNPTVILFLKNYATKKMLAAVIGSTAGLWAASNEKEVVDYLQENVKSIENFYNTYTEFLPRDYVNDHMEKHFLASMATQIAVHSFHKSISNSQFGMGVAMTKLGQAGDKSEKMKEIGRVIFGIVLLAIPTTISDYVSSGIDQYYRKNLQEELRRKMVSDVYKKENALRLSHRPNAKMLLKNMQNDVSDMVNLGSDLLTNTISSATSGIYGVIVILSGTPDLAITTYLYGKTSNAISEWLVSEENIFHENAIALSAKYDTLIEDGSEHIREITERGGVDILGNRILQIAAEKVENERQEGYWGAVSSIVDTALQTIKYALNEGVIALEIYFGAIRPEDRIEMHIANWELLSFVSLPGRNARNIKMIGSSLNRIVEISEIVHSTYSGSDKISREFIDGNTMTLKDLSVGYKEKTLVEIDELNFEMGKVYVFTGDNGAGKTSLLSKVAGVRENGVHGKGEIYYPLLEDGKEPKLVMITNDYFPPNSTLQEVLSYPEKPSVDPKLNKETREKMVALLKDIGLKDFVEKEEEKKKVRGKSKVELELEFEEKDILTLDSRRDWYNRLSDGEKKKVTIISAILKNPDILILDEIFKGVYPEAIEEIQGMLKKHLPNALILFVDHEAVNHNYNGFYYGGELHFSDGKIISRQVPICEKICRMPD